MSEPTNQLVVNFDVFGNLAHQAQTRLYFDRIHNGAEQNFLRLMTADARETILDDWYQYRGQLKLWLDCQRIDTHSRTALQLPATDPQRFFAEAL